MKSNKNVIKGIAMVTQIGISMITPIILCAFIGYELRKYFGWNFIFIILLVLGMLSGFRNVYYMTKQFYSNDKKREDQELEYIAGLKRESEFNKKKP